MKKKILIIDDDTSILDALKLALKDAGYIVQTAMKESQIFSLSPSYLPDVILLDMLLSGSDGRIITTKLKKQKETKNIPIIMMSAHPMAKKDAENSGADDFIAKPFSIDTLLTKIQQF